MKPLRTKSHFKLIVFLISCAILVVLVSFKPEKSKDFIAQGDRLFSSGRYEEANKAYIEAEFMWPPLFFDRVFQNGLKQVKEYPKKLKKEPHIFALFNPYTSNLEIQSLADRIRVMPYVFQVHTTSSGDAFEIIQKINKDRPNIIALITPGSLPASIEIILSDETQASEIEQVLRASTMIDEVTLRKDLSN